MADHRMWQWVPTSNSPQGSGVGKMKKDSDFDHEG